MADTFEPTRASSALGKWVEELYNRIFVQPDDQVSTNAFKDDVTPDFVASTKDIQIWEATDGSGAGCVAQHMHFTDISKETGVGPKSSTLLIASVKVIDGKRKLVDLTEVLKTSE
ncbi:hypothetical protein HG530_008359 [Fusarium avenaceum]|nr:hypothetical protein HG530_008359 [Fusarium avenaceum]